MGALVVAEFIERGRSGRSLERPELQRMPRYIQDTPVDFGLDSAATSPGDNEITATAPVQPQ